MIDKKIVVGHIHSNVTYNLNGSNVDHIKQTKDGYVIVTVDGARIILSSDRYIVNENEFRKEINYEMEQ